MSRLSRTWLLLLALVCSTLACATQDPEAGPLWMDASELRFDLAHPELSVEIHNRGGLGRAVTDFSLGGDDWDTLRFVDESLPRTIPAHGSVVIPLAISTAAYRVEPGVYRSGSASLRFRSNAYDYELPIHFVPPAASRPRLGPALLVLLGWAALLVLASFALLREGSRARRGPQTAWVAAALAALVTAAATLPVGFGWCAGRLGAGVGPRELAQCRAGLGGSPLVALASSPSLVWTFVALTLAALAAAAVRARGRAGTAARALGLSGVRLLALAALVAALGYGLDPAHGSLTGLLVAQAEPMRLGQLVLPRWGAFAQPIGFGLALFALASFSPAGADEPELDRLLARAERVVWSALVACLFLGGPGLPWLSLRSVPVLDHGPQLALELLAFALKVAALTWAATALHRAVEQIERGALRWLAPLALAHLAAILVWLLV